MCDLMLMVENVSKEYRLGAIGGTTLREEIQRKQAKLLRKDDPTTIIGQERTNEKGMFMALSDISFDVKKGEALGIIGHNGAGKSTLLKLITQITAPTHGTIYLNGRVASMLEVGTGFHPELTGRENIYINGAILGMTKNEIDTKIDEIIEFSECRQFIDTPVKRYSSGMYVKLAFSVAANLESEIMIMDEVLAVGDVAFQNKCIKKMKDVVESGRTILYVSHNMSTIRKLCNRCVCLEKGHILYNGDVELAIEFYTKSKLSAFSNRVDLEQIKRHGKVSGLVKFQKMQVFNYSNFINTGDNIICNLHWVGINYMEDLRIRIHFLTMDYLPIGVANSETIHSFEGDNNITVTIPTNHLMPGKYILTLMAINIDDMGSETRHDCIGEAWGFQVLQSIDNNEYHSWNTSWGSVMFEPLIISDIEGMQCDE